MTIDRYGNVVLSRDYYSNCFIEAIKEKLRNKNVRIIVRRPKRSILPHFLWKYDGDSAIYDFGTDHKILTSLWYRGYVRKRCEDNHE